MLRKSVLQELDGTFAAELYRCVAVSVSFGLLLCHGRHNPSCWLIVKDMGHGSRGHALVDERRNLQDGPQSALISFCMFWSCCRTSLTPPRRSSCHHRERFAILGKPEKTTAGLSVPYDALRST